MVLEEAMETDLPGALERDPVGTFEALVLRHQDRIFSFCLALSGNREDAEEIASDTFCRAHAALGRYDRERLRDLRVAAWLHRIALNLFRNRARRRRPAPAPLSGNEPDTGTGPEAEAIRQVAEAVLRRHLAGLPPAQRSAVVLRHVQGFRYQEIADLLGQSPATVRSNVFRGLAALRRALPVEEGVR